MEAIRSGKIEIRVYTKHKFQQLYITHPRKELDWMRHLLWSGRVILRYPNLENIEMNVRLTPAKFLNFEIGLRNSGSRVRMLGSSFSKPLNDMQRGEPLSW